MDDHEFLLWLSELKCADDHFIWMSARDAERLHALMGETYKPGWPTSGFQPSQLANYIEVALNRLTGGVYRVISS